MLDNMRRRVEIWLGNRQWYWRYLGWDHERTVRKRQKLEPHLFCSIGGTKPSICGVCRKSLKDHNTWPK